MGLNLVHLHLLLNHVPTVGNIIALGLLLLALAKKSDDLLRAGYALLFAIGLIALPTYMTGHPAAAAINGQPGISMETIEAHQSAALLALIVMEITGIVAWVGLWQARRPSGRSRWMASVVLGLTVFTFGLMASAANIGGEISHPEILADGQPPAATLAPAVLSMSFIEAYPLTHPWAWPVMETLHFTGLCLLFGVVLVGNLRIFGFMKAGLVDIHRLLPWAVGAFVVNSITGMLFYIAQASQYFDNPAFISKVILILLAGAGVLHLTLFDDVWALGPGDDAPVSAKVIVASQAVLWIGVIYFGMMLPFIGSAF